MILTLVASVAVATDALPPMLWAQRDYGAASINVTFAAYPQTRAPYDLANLVAAAQSSTNGSVRTPLALGQPTDPPMVTSAPLDPAVFGEHFLLEASCDQDVKPWPAPVVIKHTANADAVTTPHDWFDIQVRQWIRPGKKSMR